MTAMLSDGETKMAVDHKFAERRTGYGGVDWNTQIWCGAKLNPDIHGTVPQAFACK
jgi:hypothetical protein